MTELVSYESPSLPAAVADSAEEAAVAEILTGATRFLRDLEDKRKQLTVPLVRRQKEINAAAKALSEEAEAAITACNTLLSAYRLSPAFLTAENARRAAENAFRGAILAGDIPSLLEANTALETAREIAPKTVMADGAAVHFRETVVIDFIDMAKLPERYKIITVDETLIRKDLKGANVEGVAWHVERKAVMRES